MNLLEQAMRQKAMRETTRPDNPALSEVKNPSQTTSATYRRLLVIGGISAALAAAGFLFYPAKNQTMARETAEQFVEQDANAAQNKPNDNRQNVAAAVDGWVKAWSAKDADKYLSAYAPEFMPSNGLGRSAWEKQRRHRLNKYSTIEITLANLAISVEEDTATAEFIQSFKADGFSETGRKRLELKLRGSRWMIVKETSGTFSRGELTAKTAVRQTGDWKLEFLSVRGQIPRHAFR